MDVLALHRQLVAIPSVSGDELAIADFVSEILAQHAVERVGNTVIASAGEGPVFVLNSHLDTVPPQPGWSGDPWKPRREDGKVVGLGSNDAKASVAAMIAAFLNLARQPRGVTLVLMLAEGEETKNVGTQNGLAHLRATHREPIAALIGEPTGLASGVGQFGMAVARLIARGDACHAAHAVALGAVNPVIELGKDLAKLSEFRMDGVTVQPTELTGSTARNQVPGEASAILDIRLAPGIEAEAVFQALDEALAGEIEPISARLRSYALPDSGETLKRCAPEPHFVSRTMSDQTLFAGIPAIKIGPGETERSHTVDEYVFEHEILAAVDVYTRIVEDYEKALSR